VLDASIPKEWFARPPQNNCGDFRVRMLWGWRTNMELAVERNDNDKIKDLCARYPADSIKDFVERRILLTKAAGLGTARACRALLKYAHAAVDGVRSSGNRPEWIPLQESSGDEGLCKGKTPLMAAVLEGQESVVRLFLRHGANVDFSIDLAGTPLHFAVARCHASIVEELVRAGADLSIRDMHGLTALEVCQSIAHQVGGHAMEHQFESIKKVLHTSSVDGVIRCAACKTEKPLLTCLCKLEWYCNKECQRKRWKKHKQEHKEEMELMEV